MLALKPFRDKAKGMADLLNYAALVDDGIVMNKDGSLMAGYFYRGRDIASSTESERNYIASRVNAALSRFGAGWVTHHDAVRLPAGHYPAPSTSHFPDPITRMIDNERREQFEAEGAHFESEYAVVLTYMPPLRRQSKLGEMIYDDDGLDDAVKPGDRILAQFKQALAEFEDTVGDTMKLRRMTGYRVDAGQGSEQLRDELVNYLAYCITGRLREINIPSCPMYLDALLATELFGGLTPKVDGRFVAVVSIDGFPADSYQGILNVLDALPMPYCWSTRFIYMDLHEAVGELKKYRRKWRQKMRGFFSQVFRTNTGIVNEDAVQMAGETETAITEASSALVTYGYYTNVCVLMDDSRNRLEEWAREIRREVERLGFTCRVENVNTVEAWLGSLPGHTVQNVRRPLMHTLHLANLLPLSAVWTGLEHNPSRFFPPNSPPLAYTASLGTTPFRLNLHVDDVGHGLMFGPTGAGKSTKLAFIISQFFRYPNATVCSFDFGRSMKTLVTAVRDSGGSAEHYDIDPGNKSLSFAPLADLETEADRAWAEEWIAVCYELQAGTPPTPEQKYEIHRAIARMADPEKRDMRSISDFKTTVQDKAVRDAIDSYTVDGQMAHLLDGRTDSVTDTAFTVFEIETLMSLGEKNVLPTLLHLFRRFEKTLKGQPALMTIDEAWVVLGHKAFREKLRNWLKTLRRAGCAVWPATHSLSDAANSGILDVLLESCPTKILLPNEEADKGGRDGIIGPRDLYTLIGLNDTEIEILRTAQKKRHYYYISPHGRRLYDLGLGPVALSFVAVSGREELAHVAQIASKHGPQWPYQWLDERGVDYERYQS
ncbi:transporter [Xanthomonas phaseoli]|uniref:VirB4 family type IV secretion/conjugal transfer ATPase n=1 Tax=Xanthomonas phaseoli TaxID=1985254 RepID=UPI0002DAB1F9|nr:transporter [Xanthomonas phaseoli]